MKSPPVPTGIQRLLHLASVDGAFARELRARRDAMGEVAQVALTAQERAILRAIPENQLAHMIANLPAPAPERRAFFRQAAAGAVLLLGGAALPSACAETPSPTDAGEDAPERQDHVFYADGALADVPHDVAEQPDGGSADAPEASDAGTGG